VTALALILLVLLPLNWWATVSLWRLSRADSHLNVLRERAIASTALSVILTLLVLVFLNADLGVIVADFDFGRLFIRLGAVILALPAVYWLWVSRRG